jgi:hypothetical protein
MEDPVAYAGHDGTAEQHPVALRQRIAEAQTQHPGTDERHRPRARLVDDEPEAACTMHETTKNTVSTAPSSV